MIICVLYCSSVSLACWLYLRVAAQFVPIWIFFRTSNSLHARQKGSMLTLAVNVPQYIFSNTKPN